MAKISRSLSTAANARPAPRFSAGERVVIVKPGGFHGPIPLAGRIVDTAPGGGCSLCDDPHCCEWANVRLSDGQYAYHVSECCMRPDDGRRWPESGRRR